MQTSQLDNLSEKKKNKGIIKSNMTPSQWKIEAEIQ